MLKWINLIAFFILIMFRNIAIAQDQLKIAEDEDSKRDTKVYNITSLDGKKEQIHIMPDYPNHILRISCLKDTISIYDYWDVPPEISVLNKNFIEVKYEVRGGSDVGLGNVFLLCTDRKKIYEAIHVLRYMTSEGGGTDEGYHIRLRLIGNKKSNYKLYVHIHDYSHSKYDPQSNYNYNNLSILNFDKVRDVFYSTKEYLYDTFTIYDPKKMDDTNNWGFKQTISGNFPVIILGKDSYYSINKSWYGMADKMSLRKYSTHN